MFGEHDELVCEALDAVQEDSSIVCCCLPKQCHGHNEMALIKLLTDRKTNPDETWLLLEVRTATGTEPARPAEVTVPKLMLVTEDGTELAWSDDPKYDDLIYGEDNG